MAIVAAGRNMDEASVRELADGSVYSGRQALDNGLVDALGYEEDAIAKAAELGGIGGEPRIVEYSNTPDFDDFLTGLATPRDDVLRDNILQRPFLYVKEKSSELQNPSLPLALLAQPLLGK